jgi:hypothetical protein
MARQFRPWFMLSFSMKHANTIHPRKYEVQQDIIPNNSSHKLNMQKNFAVLQRYGLDKVAYMQLSQFQNVPFSPISRWTIRTGHSPACGGKTF